jgi:hypothetical protein
MRDLDKCFAITSDRVPSEVITSITKNCDRDDCCLSIRIGETTCVSTSDYYDKQGILRIHNNNSFNAKSTCKNCWKSWSIEKSFDNINIEEIT